MKTFQTLTAAGAILLAIGAPSFAAPRAATARGDVNATGSYAGPIDPPYAYRPGYNAYASGPTNWQPDAGNRYQYTPGNLPYPDRPYGDPDFW